MASILRSRHLADLERLFRSHCVVALVGARQVGKSTLARQFGAREGGPTHVFDLEDTDVAERFREAKLTLSPLRGLVILDEIQRRPALFETLRVLADRPGRPARFLVLGSAAPELLRQSSETLAGRIAYHDLGPLTLDEIGASHLERLWLRGGFPRSFLAEDEPGSVDWRRGFVRTFLERDLPQLGFRYPAETMGRLWRMLAHLHGQTWNASAIGRSFGVADTSVRRWLDALTGALVVRALPPWHENVAKRQVKAPKVYVADTGLLHSLLNLPTTEDVLTDPRCGASWESFAIAQVVARLGARAEECFFWATHASADLDLLVVRGRRRLGFEVKRTSSPGVTASMHIALADLHLDRLDLVHAGPETYPLGKNIRALALGRILEDLDPLE